MEICNIEYYGMTIITSRKDREPVPIYNSITPRTFNSIPEISIHGSITEEGTDCKELIREELYTWIDYGPATGHGRMNSGCQCSLGWSS